MLSIGKPSINGPFSMAMLNNKRVNPMKFHFPVLYPWPRRANPTGQGPKIPRPRTCLAATGMQPDPQLQGGTPPPKKNVLCWLMFTQIGSMV